MTARQLSVLLATTFAILTPAAQAIWDVGLSAAEFSQPGDETLRAAGYAFSIWSLIYLALAGYAIWQALPRNRNHPLLSGLAWPSVIAIAGCGFWIWASAANARWLTVLIIVVSATSISAALVRVSRGPTNGVKNRLLILWPLGLLAGWLTIAAVLNVLTVLTAEGLILSGARTAWAFGGLAAVTIISLAVLAASRLAVFGAPVVWGLVAVVVAERPDQPLVALSAAVAAGVVLLAALWTAWRASTAGARPAG